MKVTEDKAEIKMSDRETGTVFKCANGQYYMTCSIEHQEGLFAIKLSGGCSGVVFDIDDDMPGVPCDVELIARVQS